MASAWVALGCCRHCSKQMQRPQNKDENQELPNDFIDDLAQNTTRKLPAHFTKAEQNCPFMQILNFTRKCFADVINRTCQRQTQRGRTFIISAQKLLFCFENRFITQWYHKLANCLFSLCFSVYDHASEYRNLGNRSHEQLQPIRTAQFVASSAQDLNTKTVKKKADRTIRDTNGLIVR